MGTYRSVTIGAATISHGNQKVGDCPNVSLLPVVSCPRGIPCAHSCYDVKACKLYPTVKAARRRNWVAAKKRPWEYFSGISNYLAKYQPRYFRWHVGGDILDQDYLDRMYGIADAFPDIAFLAFTKHHTLDFRARPANLNIVLSMWPGWGNRRKRLPRAWMQDGSETRIPESAIQCTGSCEDCGVCWHIKSGQDVWFHKH